MFIYHGYTERAKYLSPGSVWVIFLVDWSVLMILEIENALKPFFSNFLFFRPIYALVGSKNHCFCLGGRNFCCNITKFESYVECLTSYQVLAPKVKSKIFKMVLWVKPRKSMFPHRKVRILVKKNIQTNCPKRNLFIFRMV